MEVENINLIRKIAWSFYNTTGLEWEELFQETCLYYYRALKTYDPNRGQKLTTYVWQSISCELINYVRKNKKFDGIFSSLESENLSDKAIESQSSFFESLNKEAQEIVDLVLSFPEIFDRGAPKKARNHIINILSKRGWSEKKIEVGLQNLKIVFS